MIVIKKRVSLEFLGDEYKDSYLVFKSIPVREYSKLQKEAKEVEKDEARALDFITEQLKSKFIEGKIQDQVVKAEDLEDLPGNVFLEAFKQIRGQIDPKV